MSKECGSIRISVVIPAYNAERYIQRAIESVLNQTYSPFEVIVIDDGSCDKTRSIVEQFGETVTCIHQENVGECQARNNGIQAANGDYIAFLDADDEWTSHHLENAAEVLGRFPELGWYSCAWERKAGPSKIGRVLRFRGKLKEGAAIEDYFSAAALSKGTIANSDTVVISRELLLSLGGFMEGMRRGGDRLMWFRLGLIEPRLGYSPSVGAIYYSIEGSATSRDDDKDPGAVISHVISAMKENTTAQGRLHSALISDDAAQVIDIAKTHGALGWKVNGAGGDGGSVTILCDDVSSVKRNMIRDIESENLLYQNIPVYLSRFGLRSWDRRI